MWLVSKVNWLHLAICYLRCPQAYFFLRETKMKSVGKIKTPNCNGYIIFELLRQQKGGGGLALGCQEVLQPVLVREGDDLSECITVKVHLKKSPSIWFVVLVRKNRPKLRKNKPFGPTFKKKLIFPRN